MSQPTYDVIVIGEGVSGLATAGSLADAGLKVATMEAQLFGGLVINVNELEPVPDGHPGSGAELAAELMQKNAERGVASIQEAVTGLRETGGAREVITDAGAYSARCVVVASGARLKRLGIPGEAEFEGRGVSQCADCDGPMYQNEDAIVVGGGDSAFQEALVLARYCRRVFLIHHGDVFKASSHFVDQVKANGKITIMRKATVDAIAGDKMVDRARVRHTDGRTEELACAGVFAYIGLEPNTAFLPDAVTRDAAGFLRTNEHCETVVPGVFAVGAVRSGFGGTLEHALKDAEKVTQVVRAQLG